MSIVSYSYAINNFKLIMEKVNKDKSTVIVNLEDGNDVVIIAEETYNQLIETVYLMNNFANAKHLIESIEQYKKEKIIGLNL